ncbi:MAG: hypothetical protein KAI63_07515, partial [Planctomycetes bacterium]|nr:hypothetical protein [Planctomycetota bacterium]
FKVLLKNIGKIDVNVDVGIDSETIEGKTIPAGQTISIDKSFTITEDTIFEVVVSGDVDRTIQTQILFGEEIETTILAEARYLEGLVGLTVQLVNKGQLDVTHGINYELTPGEPSGQESLYFIPEGDVVTDTIYYNLVSGDYEFTISSFFGQDKVDFKVTQMNQIDLNAVLSSQVNGTVSMNVEVSNVGYNDFNGQIRVQTDFYTEFLDFSLPATMTDTHHFSIPVYAAPAGVHKLYVDVLHNGIVINRVTLNLIVSGSEFELTDKSVDPVYSLNEDVTMAFKVKNTGGLSGDVAFRLEVLDIFEDTQLLSLAPGEEGDLDFTFSMPGDLLSGSYNAVVALHGVEYKVPFKIVGYDISVNAQLDKTFYNSGETATLTLNITNVAGLPADLKILVTSGTFGTAQSFNLGDSITLQYQIPVTDTLADKIYYEITAAESGRLIILDGVFIRIVQDGFLLYTDKGVYNAGETVMAYVNTTASGDLKIEAPGYSDIIAINGSTSFSFTLPEEMVLGTYAIEYQFGEISGQTMFNVMGLYARGTSCTLDKGIYDPIDTIKTKITIEINQDIQGVLKGWVLD